MPTWAPPVLAERAIADRAALADWLAQLRALLAPLQPERLVVVGGLVLPLKLQWVERLPADVHPLVPGEPSPVGQSGWLIQLEADESAPLLLFVGARERAEASETALRGVATLVRSAWRLRQGFDDESGPDDVSEAVHALRNSLNSVLMSAAVVTTCADLLPERLQPIAREIEAAAARSVQRLHRLTGLIESGY
jgi:hypothetical protein